MATANTGFRDTVSIVLGVSIPLGAHNFATCLRQAWEKQTWINWMQCAASAFQILNQICFILQFTQPADTFFKNNCTWFSGMADGFFFGYQILSVTVLIVRTTGLVPLRFQTLLRCIFGAALASAVGFILYSVIVKTTFVADNRCAAIYHRQTNLIGKIIIFCIYLSLLLVFTVPAARHLRGSHRAGLGRTNTTSYLIKIIMSVSLRICLAIIGFLLTVVLSFAEVWGNFFFIEFTVQNYFGITASTFDSTTDGKASSTSGQQSSATSQPASGLTVGEGLTRGKTAKRGAAASWGEDEVSMEEARSRK
ncbi:hypothetical protein HDU67_009980 [Dinochytrium kinnereticum]|nr:hypothetical protein HDU67_009980 [Dinochytrium kinnereticum]